MSRDKRAAVLLLVAMLWAVAPALACLRSAFSEGVPACCSSMPPDCPMQGDNAKISCCKMHGQSAAEVPDAPAPVETGLTAALLPQIAGMHHLLALSTAAELPLDPSPPGGVLHRLPILRI